MLSTLVLSVMLALPTATPAHVPDMRSNYYGFVDTRRFRSLNYQGPDNTRGTAPSENAPRRDTWWTDWSPVWFGPDA